MDFNFRSDNESPAAPEILDALIMANQGTAWSYDEDPWGDQLNAAFSELFGTATTAIPLITGTVANSIALACVTPPWGSAYCHSGAHIFNDEGGAPEFFGNGLRLMPVEGENGKLNAEDLHTAISAAEGHGIHSYLPASLSLTQSTEAGTVYGISEIEALCATARQHDMATHMDGARFANAMVTLNCSPAEVTWQSGVQMMSFGAGKNGCLAAEALLFFGETDLAHRAERLRKRSGHLLSKMRYVSAQLLAYLKNDLWLKLAAHANHQAALFAKSVRKHPEAKLEFPVEANEVFVRWSSEAFATLSESGVQFLTWPGQDDLARFVFSHHTQEEETLHLCKQFGGQ